ncbi:sigma-54-dependent transcriptional regulator [Undibacterium sp. TJN19]|uniref:sigma-54-dependent transcriptional regulator n=1 Tax=Undibacterium sp. TJN19 TaxID=3413055 RepID=UPI003BEF88EA
MTEARSLPRILIIDDDASVQVSLALLLKQSGYTALSCDEPQQAMQILATQGIDLVLQDMNFSLQTSGEEGLNLLTEIKKLYPGLPVLLMTAWGSIALAVRGVKLGAADFFTKPWNNTQLVQLIGSTLAYSPGASASKPDRRLLDQQFEFADIVGEHPELLKVLATIGRVAKTNAAVLILGESGTGKELIADAIHRNSPRAARPAIKVNMGAITPSLFESEMFGHVRGAFTDAKTDRKGHFASASQSTLFLDEIGELNRNDQVKLLRVLQNQSYQPVGASKTEQADVRIISATNRELAELVAANEFREDLFYRLNLITIRLPALRERRSDIPLLAQRLIADLTRSYGMPAVVLSPSALNWLSSRHWPGNIRQLRQCLERTLLLVDKPLLEQNDFLFSEQHEEAQQQASVIDGLTLDQVEKHMIEKAMEQHQGNITRVAKVLGLSRFTLYRRLEKHQIVNAEADDNDEYAK